MKKGIFGIVMIMTLLPACLSAVEIPLERGAFQGGGKNTAVGFVDIEKIFAEHPLKKRLQEEYKAEVDKRKKEIEKLDASIQDTEKVIVSSTTELNRAKLELDIIRSMVPAPRQETPAATGALIPGTTMSVPATEGVEGSTGTVETGALPSRSAEPAVIQGKEAAVREKEAAIDGLKKELEQQRASLRLKVRQNKDELSQLEEKQTAEVLADMYELLQKVAKDENVTIIIDKNDILYGQASLDLTDKVRERLQGR